MSTIAQLAASISLTAADYRTAELGPFTAGHVIMWVNQFDPEERLPVLDELNHVLKRTYLTEANMEEFLIKVAANQKFVGADAKAFWKSVGVLRVQTGG